MDIPKIIQWINEFRQEKGLNVILNFDDIQNIEDVKTMFKQSHDIAIQDSSIDMLSLLQNEINQNEMFSNKILLSAATHVEILSLDDVIFVNIYQYYGLVKQVMPMINGSMVIEGTCIEDYGPALCTIEHSTDNDVYVVVAVIPPWQMDFTPSIEMPSNFTIIVSLGNDVSAGSTRVKIYVGETSGIPYSINEDDSISQTNYNMDPESYILAVEYVANAVSEASLDNNEVEPDALELSEESDSSQLKESTFEELKSADKLESSEHIDANEIKIVADVKVCTEYSDAMEYAKEGYELRTATFTENGIERDTDHMWKFYIMAKYGPIEDGGLEDIEFITCPKSLGTVPALDGFKVYSDDDLALWIPDCQMSIFFAAKFGNKPRFTTLTMLLVGVDMDSFLAKYLESTHSIFKKANSKINEFMNGIAGIALSLPIFDDKTEGSNNISSNKVRRKKFSITKSNGVGSNASESDEGASDDDESDDDFDGNGSEQAGDDHHKISLAEELERLKKHQTFIVESNGDLQRKCVELILKESETRAHTVKRLNSTISTADNEEDNADETIQLYMQMVNSVKEKRTKLANQQEDFDQLALDLQTRLDDKEAKMKEVSAVYMKLKKDTLSHTINAASGKRYTKKEIDDIDETEQKKYDVLEKVRIKHITLKSHLKKIERLLAKKEQLAEGLHVIDFEQLKIENQSLHEKIQERNDNITKLKRKRTLAIQILTHIREKLHFLEKENTVKMEALNQTEKKILHMRSLLSTVRQDHDEMNQENKDMKTRQQFANSGLLVKDFEDRKLNNEKLRCQLEELKSKYERLKYRVGDSKGTRALMTANSNTTGFISPHKPILRPLTNKKPKHIGRF